MAKRAVIRLGAGYEIDPSVADSDARVPDALRANIPTESQVGHFLVQFRDAITRDAHALLDLHGGKVHAYIPDRCLLVSLTGRAHARIDRSLLVAWTGLYHPAYKNSPRLLIDKRGKLDATVLLFPNESIEAVEDEMTAVGGQVIESHDNGINRILRVKIDSDLLSSTTHISAVAWIEPNLPIELCNDQCQWVVQTGIENNRRI